MKRSWRWRRRLVRIRRLFNRGLGILLLLVIGIVALISQTGRGQDFALRTALDQVRSSLAGELTIEGVRSGTLLTGATLTGVSLVAEDGRPFVVADSVVLRYSILSMFFGGSPIRSTVLWGVDLEISQYTADQEMNLQGLIPDREAIRNDSGPSDPLELGHIGIREGRARVLTPAEESTRTRIVIGPGGERLRELAFEDLDLDVEDVLITPGGVVVFQARLASFSSSIGIVEDPLIVSEAFGEAMFGDSGLLVSDAAFRLQETLLEGDLTFGPAGPDDGWTFHAALASDDWGELAELQWIDPRIPDGRFRGGMDLTVSDGIHLDLDGVEIQLEASHLLLDGPVSFTTEMELGGISVDASPVTLARLEPWIGRELPIEGWLSGRATFEGTLQDITAQGELTLVPTGYGGSPVSADFSGTIYRGSNPGARGFEARIDPMNYTVLEALWPNLPLEGTGAATVRLDGRVADGFIVEADLAHESPTSLASTIELEGLVRESPTGEGWISDLDVQLRPLSLGIFADLAPDLQLQGVASGPVTLVGSATDMRVSGDVMTSGGRVSFDGQFDPRTPASGYALEVVADSLSPASLSARLPARTLWSGSVDVEGSGFSADSADVSAVVALFDSRVGSVRVDSIAARARLQDGTIFADSLRARVAGIGVSGRGSLGLVEGRTGSAQVDFDASSVIGLRPLLMGVGDSVMVRDGLSELDRDFLRAQGIEPDTLPTAEDVRLDGAVVGTATFTGAVTDFDLGLIVGVTNGQYQENAVESAQVGFTATSLPALTGSWQLGVSANGIALGQRTFQQGGFEADMFAMDGDGRIEILRRPGEQYRAVGSFSLDSIGGFVDLTEASIEVADQRWDLSRPARVAWTETMVSVDSVDVRRTGGDPMHLSVDGELTRGGESDFRVLIDGLHLEQVLDVAQIEDVEAEGHVEAELTVRGTASAPRIQGTFLVDDPRYGGMSLTRLTGSIDYQERLATVELEGEDGTRSVLTGGGTIPLDLSLVGVEQRVIDAPMDFRIGADSLDAAVALSYVTALDDVDGWITGEVRVLGTPRAPEPQGSVRLTDGAWSIEEIGVRHVGIDGNLLLRPDRVVEVDVTTSSSGNATISGTVLLEPVNNPVFDLDFSLARFLAVSRVDMEGFLSGDLNLAGTYDRPLVTGTATVDQGTIYIDELQRSVGVVDLSDPFLFDIGLAVDTTALATQPLLAGFQNPFFDNLRVDVDLSVPRDSWLRGIATNIELRGDLLVRYDRFAGDFVLIGELEAVRGSHLVLGRTFQLSGGNVSFIGRPGLNPDLDVQATARIRSPDNPPLDVNAQLGGTLVRPVVTLTSDQAGLAEEDLVSYLIFGRPSGQLGIGTGAAQTAVRQTGVQALGAAANQLGSVLAADIPILELDYLAYQQGTSASGNIFGDPRIEAGRYFGEDLFAIVVVRPWNSGPEDQNAVAGIRVEWALTDDYNVEGFFEDRFLRSGSTSLATSSGVIENDQIWGVFLFREWGYSLNRER